MRALAALLLAVVAALPADAASVEDLVRGLVDRAADRPVDVARLASALPRHRDFRCWNGCPYVGSQNIPVIAAAAAGDFTWVAALARHERLEGLYGHEVGSPGFYFAAVQDAKMVALRDARRAGDIEAAAALALALRASWALDALVAIETPRASTWADLGGDGEVEGAGNAGTYLGLTVAVAGNRWNGSGRGERWLDGDAHGPALSWALDWSPRRQPAGGTLRNPRPGRGTVAAFLAGVDAFEAPTAPEVWGLTSAERNVLQRVVRGDVEAAREAAEWLSDFGLLRQWTFTLTRTTAGAQMIFWGPYPNPNKPPHASTSISTNGAWRTIRPSRWGRGSTIWDYRVDLQEGDVVASVRDTPPVRMPLLAGELLWEVTLAAGDVRWRGGGGAPDLPVDRPRGLDVLQRRPLQ